MLDAAAAARVLIAVPGFVLQATWEPGQDLKSSFATLDELVRTLLLDPRQDLKASAELR